MGVETNMKFQKRDQNQHQNFNQEKDLNMIKFYLSPGLNHAFHMGLFMALMRIDKQIAYNRLEMRF